MYKKFKILFIGLFFCPLIKPVSINPDGTVTIYVRELLAYGLTYALYKTYTKRSQARALENSLKQDPNALITISLDKKFSQNQNLIREIIEIHKPDINKQMSLDNGADGIILHHTYDLISYNEVITGTPLHLAVANDNFLVAKELLHAGAEVNIKNSYLETALHNVKSIKMAQLLIDAGTDVNNQSSENFTPFMAAITNYLPGLVKLELVKLLMQSGAKVNVQDNNGRTPLHRVVNTNKGTFFEIITLLIDAGVNVNCQDLSGNTPLHDHIHTHTYEPNKKRSMKPIEILITKGALTTIKNNDGQTPLLIAARRNHRSTFNELIVNNFFHPQQQDINRIPTLFSLGLHCVAQNISKITSLPNSSLQNFCNFLETDEFFRKTVITNIIDTLSLEKQKNLLKILGSYTFFNQFIMHHQERYLTSLKELLLISDKSNQTVLTFNNREISNITNNILNAQHFTDLDDVTKLDITENLRQKLI